jgi:tetratricopeptide (TPR) repeat protein
MALVFLNKQEGSGPATTCAEHIAADVSRHNESCHEELKLDVRMGLHSGNVIKINDINGHSNVAGEGINTAQRVMDCGDAGHILLSSIAKHLLPAESDRVGQLTGLGEVRVKHNQAVELFNLCNEKVGKSQLPQKVLAQRQWQRRKKIGIVAAVVVPIILAFAIWSVWQRMKGTAAPPTIAILPIKPTSNKGTSELISFGLTEQFIRNANDYTAVKPQSDVDAALATGPGQQPPSASQVGQKLNAQYVLTGTADARTENELENFDKPNTEFLVDVHLELYKVGNETPVFQKNYPGTQFKDLMMLPRSFATEAAKVMGVSVQKTSSETDQLLAQDAKAYWNYLQGRYWWSIRPSKEANKEEVKKVTDNAIKSFQAAITSNSRYALAYSGLADVYITIGGLTQDPLQSKNEALAAASAALDSNPKLAPAYASMGMAKCWFERDFLAAKVAFLGALGRDPNYVTTYRWYSACLNNFGKTDEAEQTISKAAELEPNNLIVSVTHAQNYYFSDQNQKAITLLERVLQKDPKMPIANRFLAFAYEREKQWNKALELIQKAANANNNNDDSDVLGGKGHIFAAMQNYKDAEQAAQRLEYLRSEKKTYVSPYNIALVYAAIPRREDKAFEMLDAAIREGDPRITWLKVDPRFATLRQSRGKEFDARLRDAHLGDS